MARLIIICLLFCIGCSSPQAFRKIASDNLERYGDVDIARSNIRLLPEFNDSEGDGYRFYIQLRDGKGKFVDCAYNEIILSKNGNSIPFKFERILTGRYYLIIKKEDLARRNIKLHLQGQTFNDDLESLLTYPHKKNSQIKLISNSAHMIRLQLHLADEMNRPIVINESPEIILEGLGTIGDLKQVRNGVWEFSVLYPDDNQIMYFSVYACGVFLPKIYRYQHVEK